MFVQFADYQFCSVEFRYLYFCRMQSVLEKQFAELATKPENNEKGLSWDCSRVCKLREVQVHARAGRENRSNIEKLPLGASFV